MNPADTTQQTELILRRLEGTFSDWVILFPAAFAFVILFLILFFRQEKSVGDMLKAVGFDAVHITTVRKRNSNKALFEFDVSARA